MENSGVEVRIDGRLPLSAELVENIVEACDAVEAAGASGAAGPALVVRVSGVPGPGWADGLTVGLVSKWERSVRRLERLPAATIAIAEGDCGGQALDVLLAADYRVAAASARLVVPTGTGATWPGMALFRLVQQGSNSAAVRRAVLFGEPIDAAAALALQVVDEVTDDLEGALAAAVGLAARIPGAELAIRRQLIWDAVGTSFEDALGVHLAACDRALRRAGTGGRS